MNDKLISLPVCVIVGAGDGNGMAFARRFQQEGYAVALLARNLDALQQRIDRQEVTDHLHAFASDVTSPTQVVDAFSKIKVQLGDPAVMIYNAGNAVLDTIDNANPAVFELAWQINARGLLLCSQQILPAMESNAKGCIVVIGATASGKGSANFLSFASAKAAQQNMAQSMARYLGPRNIHVAYVIVDGVIKTPMTAMFFGAKPESFFLRADAIASSVAHLVQQESSAWTYLIDLRPFGENW